MKRFIASHLWPRLRVRLRRSGHAGRGEGESLYEFALLLPLLSVIVLGTIYGGITLYDYVILADAVAQGASTLAIGRGSATPCTSAQTAVQTHAYNLNQTYLPVCSTPLCYPGVGQPTFTGPNGSSCSVTTTGTTNPNTGANCTTTAPCQILGSGDYGTITTTYPCTWTIPFIKIGLCSNKQTTGTGVNGVTCSPTAPCYFISSQTTVRIE